MSEKKVGIGEVRVEKDNATLVAYGVGSCVVIILYDTEKRIGGLAHCLLPFGNGPSLKYPKGAIEEMINRMSEMGAQQDKFVAKIVGGATMFDGFEKQAIGRRNVKQARQELEIMDIPVIAEDVFGNWGRSIIFNIDSGEVIVKSFKHGVKIL